LVKFSLAVLLFLAAVAVLLRGTVRRRGNVLPQGANNLLQLPAR
jgi:hypothetical protein